MEWPVTNEERDGERGWGRFRNEQICRLKIRRMKEEWAQTRWRGPGASPRWSGLMRTPGASGHSGRVPQAGGDPGRSAG
ncbi:MAG: DUF7021 domain-containing protein [Neglectibacter sp.]